MTTTTTTSDLKDARSGRCCELDRMRQTQNQTWFWFWRWGETNAEGSPPHLDLE